MKNILSGILLGSTLGLPMLLLVMLSYLGTAHPLEQKKLPTPSFLSNSEHAVEIVFFGYVGCLSICPTSLAKLSTVLDDLDNADASEVGVTFIDVATQKKQTAAREYGHQFSEKIRGINVTKKELEQITKSFAIRITSSYNKTDQLFHTDHFFILNRKENKWTINRVMANSTEPSAIHEAITNLLN